MSIIYSPTAIDYRLAGVVAAIDSGGTHGWLRLLSGVLTVANIPLAIPCGTVSNGVLDFTSPQTDPSAVGGGNATAAQIENSLGVVMVSGLTVGAPLSGADIIISNGVNSTLINPTQAVTMLSGQFIGN